MCFGEILLVIGATLGLVLIGALIVSLVIWLMVQFLAVIIESL